MSVEPGTLVGRYEIQRRLGRGGMGAVYVAHDPVLGRMVAIKMFAADVDVPDASERFWREARSAALLSHPNIVTTYDFGEIDGQPYIVMEYVPGEPLSQIIRRRAAVALTDKLRWIAELCAGAGYAHRMSIVHRDIKPANLMIDKSGRLKILDFGIARMLGTASNTGIVGTAGYMAPEQIKGEEIDHRADLFAVGVVFYELIAYTEAFPGEMPATIMHRVLSQDPVPLRQIVVDCHPEIAEICDHALMKNRDERFESATAMGSAVDRLRHQLEADTAWTMLPGAVAPSWSGAGTPPASTATSSASPASGASVSAPAATGGAERGTRPSVQRRTDRELLARTRADLLAAAVEEGRRELALGNASAAFACCRRALAIDENDAGAVAFEAAVHARFSASDEGTPLRDAEATMAGPPLAPSTHDSDSAATVFDGAPATAPVPVPGVAERSVALPPPSTTQTAPAPSVTSRPEPAPRTSPGPARRARTGLLIAGAVTLLVALAAGALLMRAPAPTGVIVIDAAPWGEVVAIQTEDGRAVALPSPASTPLSLSIPAGKYRVSLRGPAPGSDTRALDIQVDPDAVRVAPLSRFDAISVDDYFTPYLDAAASAAVAPEPAP